MSQTYSNSALIQSYKIYPEAGMMLNGLVSQRAAWVTHTHVRDCSLLPTPTRTANQLCESMQHSAGCRRFQEIFGTNLRIPPWIFEYLMGFPNGWTDLD